jgi:hypothetical protein
MIEDKIKSILSNWKKTEKNIWKQAEMIYESINRLAKEEDRSIRYVKKKFKEIDNLSYSTIDSQYTVINFLMKNGLEDYNFSDFPFTLVRKIVMARKDTEEKVKDLKYLHEKRELRQEEKNEQLQFKITLKFDTSVEKNLVLSQLKNISVKEYFGKVMEREKSRLKDRAILEKIQYQEQQVSNVFDTVYAD